MTPAQLVAAATRRRAVDAAIALVCNDIDDSAAFESLCAAVSYHLEARREAAAAPAPSVPFGPKAGQPLTALALGELHSLERYVTNALRSREKQRFRSANLSLRAALVEELHRRGRVSPPAHAGGTR